MVSRSSKSSLLMVTWTLSVGKNKRSSERRGHVAFFCFLFLSLFFFLFSLPSFTFFHLNTMLVLFETPAGYALFKVKKDDKVADIDNLYKEFETADKANKM